MIDLGGVRGFVFGGFSRLANGLHGKSRFFDSFFLDTFFLFLKGVPGSLAQKGLAEGADPVGHSFERLVLDFRTVRDIVFCGFWKLEHGLERKNSNCQCK